MEIYIKKENGTLEPIDFREVLRMCFERGKVKLDEINFDEFSDGSSRWLEIIKRSDDKEVTTTIGFSEDYNFVDDFEIHVVDIKKVVDEDHSKRLV